MGAFRKACVALSALIAIIAIPSSATSQSCSTLQALIDATPAGGTLALGACNYFETAVINKPMTIDGQNQATIYGSDVWTGWSVSGSDWVSTLTVPNFSSGGTGTCAAATPNCNWQEQVFRDGTPLVHAGYGTNPTPGQFALDASRHVVLGDNPAGHQIQVTTREQWLLTTADNVTIQRLTFYHAANPAQSGAISNQGRNGWTLQDSSLYSAHGGIVSLGGASNVGTQTRVLRNNIAGSSYIGLNGYQNVNTLIQGNTVWDNNLGGFDGLNWGGGGMKPVAFTNLTIDNNTLYQNYGSGIWCDIGCSGVTISNNSVRTSTGPGIFYEISHGALIYGNEVWDTLDNDWPAIYISGSADVEVYDNVVADSQRGIQAYDVNRSDRPPAGLSNVTIRDNYIVMPTSTISLFWGDDIAGLNVSDSGQNNHGIDNQFWYPSAEGATRYVWGPTSYTSLTSFAATNGGQGSSYMSDATACSVLQARGVPTAPVTCSGSTPTPTPTPTVTPTPTPTPTPASNPTATPTPTPIVSGPLTVTFNDLSAPRSMNSVQYPLSIITWSNNWWLHPAAGSFTTNSIAFDGAPRKGTLRFDAPRQLKEVDVYNRHASKTATVTFTCNGTYQTTVAANTMSHLTTGLTGSCLSLEVVSTTGDETRFDNFVIQ